VGKWVDWSSEGTLVAATFREQIGALVEAGVDLLLFETFSDARELEVAIAAARELGATPIVASMSYGNDGMTLAGQSVAEATLRLSGAGVDVIGANCSTGPANMLDVVRMMHSTLPNAMFAATPNAGLPAQDENGNWRYPVGPEEFASYVSAYVELGTRLVGGCCGTTPEYVAAMRTVVDRLMRNAYE
jgi:methionine synthase I (cobalamin-dependent)